MSKARTLALLLLLAACHRGKVADVTIEADRAAENATAAKTVADLAAADEASGTPLPRPRATPPAGVQPGPAEDAAPEPDQSLNEGNSQDPASR